MKRVAISYAIVLACGARTELRGTPVGPDIGGDASWSDANTNDGGLPPKPCTVTEPTVLASGGKQIQFIALDEANVYWTDYSLGTVNVVPKAGGAPVVLASARANPSGLVAVSGNVYWAEFSGNIVASVPTSGGDVTTLASNQDGAYAMTAVGDTIYWTTLRGCSVARLKPNEAKPETLAYAKQPFTSIVGTNALVFWVSFEQKAVERFDVSADTATTLFSSNSDLPSALAADDANVYFAAPSTNQITISEIPSSGGATQILYDSTCAIDAGASSNGCLASLATDGARMYFTAAAGDNADAGDGGIVRKFPLDGGAAELVANAQPRPFSIAVDDHCVYWSNFDDGTIWAAPK